jgi:alpha-L-fucosidase
MTWLEPKATSALCRSVRTRGLRVGVKYHALLKRDTNVETRFKQTSKRAEGRYVEALITHYQSVKKSTSIIVARTRSCPQTNADNVAITYSRDYKYPPIISTPHL